MKEFFDVTEDTYNKKYYNSEKFMFYFDTNVDYDDAHLIIPVEKNLVKFVRDNGFKNIALTFTNE